MPQLVVAMCGFERVAGGLGLLMPKLKAVVAGMCDGLHNRVLMKTSGGVAASGQRTRTAALPRSDEANSGYGWEFRKQLCEGLVKGGVQASCLIKRSVLDWDFKAFFCIHEIRGYSIEIV